MSSASALADEEGRKVFIGGLSFDAREEDLKTDFGKYGELEDVQLPWGEGGKHKGFAFITYRKADDANYAAKEHHQREYLGREISAKVVVPREQRGGGGRGGGDRYGDEGGGRGGLPQLPREMEDKLEAWVAAKRQRDFETSDRLRAEMKEAGFNPEAYRPPPGKGDGGYGGGGGGYGGGGYGGGGGGRYDDRGGGRYDDRRGRDDDRYDDRRGGDRYRQRSYSPDRRRRSPSPDRRRDDRRDDRRGRDDRY